VTRWGPCLVATAIALTACGPDSSSFQLELHFERGESHNCPSDSCGGVPMTCDARMLVRIADAADPDTVWLSACVDVAPEGSLCSLSSVVLPAAEIPQHFVRVQVAVWPTHELPTDMIASGGCPHVEFDHANQIESIRPTPALAGIDYVEVGADGVADVTLGCVDDLALSAPECSQNTFEVETHVDDFELFLPVTPAEASTLTVSLGEPRRLPAGSTWVLDDLDEMEQTILQPQPTWTTTRVIGFERTACVQTISDEIQASATIRCARFFPGAIDEGVFRIDGMQLDDATLDRLEQTLGGLPSTGLVVGQVVGLLGGPAEGAVVVPSRGTVLYLSPDLSSTNTVATTSSGVFVSLDAPFAGDAGDPTTWAASDGTNATLDVVIGGIVDNKVSTVSLHLAPPEPG